MRINSNGWLYWWAYLASDNKPSGVTDLCSLFWRVVLWTPAKCIFLAVLGGIVLLSVTWLTFGFAGELFYGGHFVAGSVMVALASFVWLYVLDATRNREGEIEDAFALVGEYISQAKEPICPLVKIT